MFVLKIIKRVTIRVLGRHNALRIIASVRKDPQLVRYVIKRMLHKRARALWPQQVFRFESKIALNPELLATDLAELNVCVHSGAHAVYIHEQAAIEKLCPELLRQYTYPFGVKIIKSRSPAPDGTVYYTSARTSPYTTPLAMWTVGSMPEKLTVGNILSLHGITPRVYDLIWLEHPDTAPLMAMVVEHAGHESVTGDEGAQFIERFIRNARQEGITIVDRKNSRDLRAPTFNGNIIRSKHGPTYVDIQNMVLLDRGDATDRLNSAGEVTQFGNNRLNRLPYQSVPKSIPMGKHDISVRMAKIESMLRDAEFEFQGARILDVGCSLGTFIAFFLWKGASHCIGMDTSEVVETTRKILYHFGYSRFDLIGGDLRSHEVWEDIADFRSVDLVLMLAMKKHIEFQQGLTRVDWKYLIYEGEGGELLENACRDATDIFPGATVMAHEVYQNGDNPPRPMVLLRSARKNSAGNDNNSPINACANRRVGTPP